MNEEEIKEYLAEFDKFVEEILASKESTKEFLKRLGIHDSKGNLTKRYKPPQHNPK